MLRTVEDIQADMLRLEVELLEVREAAAPNPPEPNWDLLCFWLQGRTDTKSFMHIGMRWADGWKDLTTGQQFESWDALVTWYRDTDVSRDLMIQRLTFSHEEYVMFTSTGGVQE